MSRTRPPRTAPVRTVRPHRPSLTAHPRHRSQSVPSGRAGVTPAGAPGRHTAPAHATAPSPGTAPRGFALYVGIDEAKAAASGVNLGVLVDALRRTLAELAPDGRDLRDRRPRARRLRRTRRRRRAPRAARAVGDRPHASRTSPKTRTAPPAASSSTSRASACSSTASPPRSPSRSSSCCSTSCCARVARSSAPSSSIVALAGRDRRRGARRAHDRRARAPPARQARPLRRHRAHRARRRLPLRPSRRRLDPLRPRHALARRRQTASPTPRGSARQVDVSRRRHGDGCHFLEPRVQLVSVADYPGVPRHREPLRAVLQQRQVVVEPGTLHGLPAKGRVGNLRRTRGGRTQRGRHAVRHRHREPAHEPRQGVPYG